MEKKNLVIACGGTGGHLFPGLAVAQEWRAQGGEVLLLVSEKKIDQEAAKKYTEYKFETIPALPKPPTLSLAMPKFLWNLWRTTARCRGILRSFQADAVLGMGGFTSFPPIVAGKRLKIPGFIHDSNAIPGKANRLTARWCEQVFLGWEVARSYFPKKQCLITGTPVREELQNLPSREEAAKKWGLDAARPVLLVMGGSQGAHRINELVTKINVPQGVQILHIVGPAEEAQVAELVSDREHYVVLGFCNDMASAYAVADAVVARAGASSMTELGYIGLASLLIPFPYAADDHQTANAKVFSEQGAALMVQEKGLDIAKLEELIDHLLEPETREEMAKKAKALSPDNAASQVVAGINEVLKQQK